MVVLNIAKQLGPDSDSKRSSFWANAGTHFELTN